MIMKMENCRIRKAISGNTDPARTVMSSPLLLVFKPAREARGPEGSAR